MVCDGEKCTIIDNRNELKTLTGQHMDSEIEGDSGDTYKLIDDVVSMVEKINQIQKFFRQRSSKIHGKIEYVKKTK